MTLSSLLIEETVQAALKEDLGHGHDITTQSLIPGNIEAEVQIISRADGVLAGLVPGLSAFTFLDPDFEISIEKQDGDVVASGDVIASLTGPANALLTGERTALNFMSHLSGVATLTALYVQAVQGTEAQIACTRKTLPGLRAFQKYAVSIGGGMNHRFGLDDAILIKDNHIAIAGSVEDALDRALSGAGHTVKIEIEVDTLEQLDEVLDHGGADIVMLDNFDLDTLKTAVKKIDGRLITETSGGVTLGTVQDIAQTGVDIISVGALTHSAAALDIGLDIDL